MGTYRKHKDSVFGILKKQTNKHTNKQKTPQTQGDGINNHRDPRLTSIHACSHGEIIVSMANYTINASQWT